MSKAYDRAELVEGLSTLMRIAKSEGEVKRAKESRMDHSIIHLLFEDDCILFGEASDRGVYAMNGILKECEVCLGQCINYDKLLLYFSSNSPGQARNLVS
ncbi:hypothetical protein PVK06_025306 [Gossypium arboreum]|uniref:Reverse transcriptase n=1 Tax=Gossypium arboreum TaxID=29729 RepID=A0ABR0PG52_GOSAR|nr:hypothetical protein PVK06_025306 [Gossypium arboreum]